MPRGLGLMRKLVDSYKNTYMYMYVYIFVSEYLIFKSQLMLILKLWEKLPSIDVLESHYCRHNICNDSLSLYLEL